MLGSIRRSAPSSCNPIAKPNLTFNNNNRIRFVGRTFIPFAVALGTRVHIVFQFETAEKGKIKNRTVPANVSRTNPMDIEEKSCTPIQSMNAREVYFTAINTSCDRELVSFEVTAIKSLPVHTTARCPARVSLRIDRLWRGTCCGVAVRVRQTISLIRFCRHSKTSCLWCRFLSLQTEFPATPRTIWAEEKSF